MASDLRFVRPRGCFRCAPALLLLLAGCKLLIPELFEGDDCSPWNDRPIEARFETSEGPVTLEKGQILLSAAGDVDDCYTGISLTLYSGEGEDSSCSVRIQAPATASGLGDEWPIDWLTFGAREDCDHAPPSIRNAYQWDFESPGGYIKIIRPDTLAAQLEDGCLREGIEIHLNARMVLAGPNRNPDSLKEFWFTENTYFIDEPLPVVEAFDCPF